MTHEIPPALSPEADLYMRINRIHDALTGPDVGEVPGLGGDRRPRDYPHGTLRKLAKRVALAVERANQRRCHEVDRETEETLEVWLDLLLPLVPAEEREFVRRGFWFVYDGLERGAS